LEESLDSNKLAFESIASVLKVLSFMFVEQYIIYDARVAYAINWIFLKTNSSKVFFTMPESRNSKLDTLDISILSRLSNIKGHINNIGINKMVSNSDKNIFIKSQCHI
jgi:hypothetical protein